MKKYTPFIVTGLLSAALAFGLFVWVNDPVMLPETQAARTVLTNFSPFDEGTASAPTALPDLVKASHTSKQAVA